MKETLTDANFPRTADLRTYHVGLRPGEVANRIVTVGSPSRARQIALLLAPHPTPFELSSERGFLTITGRYQDVPISIVSIGMGSPNMDFFVREVRECLSGDMVVIRLGSCGALEDIAVGSVVVPNASVSVTRNVDFDFVNGTTSDGVPYRISKPAFADVELHSQLQKALESTRPISSEDAIFPDAVNASADSFYSSQGRQTSFPDHNSQLLEHLQSVTENLATLEMETFHLFHLASCWGHHISYRQSNPPPVTTDAVLPTMSAIAVAPTEGEPSLPSLPLQAPPFQIRAAAAHMVFASRTSQNFITPTQVKELERWTGEGVLKALSNFEIREEALHKDSGSVWGLG